jgi:hypothetical protein
MNDAMLIWGGDLSIGATGDIALASGSVLGQQRVLRRLLTNTNAYVWHPQYGASLGTFVGGLADERQITGAIRSQILVESSVARQPAPTVAAVVDVSKGLFISIGYVDAVIASTESLAFSLSG